MTDGVNKKGSTMTDHLRKVCWEINRTDRASPHRSSVIHKAITKLKLCSAWRKKEQQDVGELFQILIGDLEEEKSQAWELFRGW